MTTYHSKETPEMLRLQNIVAMVKEMRTAQREYFRTKSRSSLELSKELEKRVDAALKECGLPDVTQSKIF